VFVTANADTPVAVAEGESIARGIRRLEEARRRQPVR